MNAEGLDCGDGKMCEKFTEDSLALQPVQGVCPEGWHLPSYRDFEELLNAVDQDFGTEHSGRFESKTAGVALKSKYGWKSSDIAFEGADAYGFSALPAGFRSGTLKKFSNVGFFGYFWTSSEYEYWEVYSIIMDANAKSVFSQQKVKLDAYSVRCLKN